jgi:tripartite-type tricarboxylate transporter receptor subunit TctC
MRRFRSLIASLFTAAILSICQSFTVHAQDRVALVIGNGNYMHAGVLPNPANDARAVAAALRDIGFTVVSGSDLDRRGMEGALFDFIDKARAAKVALIFYAGHGLQVEGRNYLVPVDARLESARDLAFGMIELDKVLASLDDPNRANIIVLDACRDNPLARSFASKSRSGAVGAGLAPYSALGIGTLIAFATAPDKVALDGSGSNSPFTEGFVKHVRTPGLEVRQMLTRVRADVANATNDRQVPWDNSSLRGDVYLTGLPGAAEAPRPPASSPPPAPQAARPAPGPVAALPSSSPPSFAPVNVPAANYPTRAVTLVVPFGAGGPADGMARAVAQKLSEGLRQPITVDNKPGAGGTLGAGAVASATADGYTLLVANSAVLSLSPSLIPNLPYDSGRDLIAVGQIATSPQVLVVPAALSAKSLAELIDQAKKPPGGFKYASPGAGTLPHLAGAQFAAMSRAPLAHAPAAGTGPALAAITSGQVQMMFADLAVVAPQIKSGQLRALAVAAPRRLGGLPNVPTMAEAGVSGFEAAISHGMLAPKSTPPAIVAKLNAALRNAIVDSGTRKRLSDLGLEVTPSTPDEHARTIAQDTARWSKAIQDAGIKPN